jgi:hypothetical protein
MITTALNTMTAPTISDAWFSAWRPAPPFTYCSERTRSPLFSIAQVVGGNLRFARGASYSQRKAVTGSMRVARRAGR